MELTKNRVYKRILVGLDKDGSLENLRAVAKTITLPGEFVKLVEDDNVEEELLEVAILKLKNYVESLISTYKPSMPEEVLEVVIRAAKELQDPKEEFKDRAKETLDISTANAVARLTAILVNVTPVYNELASDSARESLVKTLHANIETIELDIYVTEGLGLVNECLNNDESPFGFIADKIYTLCKTIDVLKVEELLRDVSDKGAHV
jgi:hypothetical protein